MNNKKLHISWMLKMRNDEFTDLMKDIHHSIETLLKDGNQMQSSRFILDKAMNQLSGLKTRDRGHANTALINEQLDRLKSLLSGINSIVDGMSKSPNEEHVAHAQKIAIWLSYFPKRPYDKGSAGIRQWFRQLLDDFNSTASVSIRESASVLGLTIYFDEIDTVLEKANSLLYERTVKLGERGRSNAIELKQKAYHALQYFINELKMVREIIGDDDILDNLFSTLSLKIGIARAIDKRRKTMRNMHAENQGRQNGISILLDNEMLLKFQQLKYILNPEVSGSSGELDRDIVDLLVRNGLKGEL